MSQEDPSNSRPPPPPRKKLRMQFVEMNISPLSATACGHVISFLGVYALRPDSNRIKGSPPARRLHFNGPLSRGAAANIKPLHRNVQSRRVNHSLDKMSTLKQIPFVILERVPGDRDL